MPAIRLTIPNIRNQYLRTLNSFLFANFNNRTPNADAIMKPIKANNGFIIFIIPILAATAELNGIKFRDQCDF